MSRKISPTTKSDVCSFDKNCPFECPLKTCVKEYPGGLRSFLKDREFLSLIYSGMDIHAAGKQMGISSAAVERRYAHAINFARYQTKEVSTG